MCVSVCVSNVHPGCWGGREVGWGRLLAWKKRMINFSLVVDQM